MPNNASLLKFVRLTHLYLGVLIAPCVLFFAITGAYQTFDLHKVSKTSGYKPAKLVAMFAEIHRNQTPVLRPVKSATAGTSTTKTDTPKDLVVPPTLVETHNALPLKIFFLLVSISLVGSTFTGIYMTYKYKNNKALVGGLLIAGAILPVLLTFVI